MIFIEAMHLLPHPFALQTPYSSSQGRLREQRHSSSRALFIYCRKPAAPPPAAGFFRFTQGHPKSSSCSSRKNEQPLLCATEV